MEDEPIDDPLNLLSFRPVDEPAGLTIVDHVERRRCTLHTSEEVDPHEAPKDEFYFPVDRGVSIGSVSRISFPHKVAVCVRNHAGFLVSELTEGDTQEFPFDRYSVELTSPIKLYLTFDRAFSIEVTPSRVNIEFDTSGETYVGARSHHESPAGTITTTDDPEDMMTAISYFGSALKTSSVERSYPTLRGHPPTLELGEKLQVPPIFEKPDNGIRLVLPANYKSVYTAAPLVYYLGATIEPGNKPRLETERGFCHALDDTAHGFESEIERALKQIFFLDCITRTEGYYPVNLYERSQLEGKIDLEFEEIYEMSISEQMEHYLDIPYSNIEPYLPKWKLTAHMTLKPGHISLLPFLVTDLAIIRTTTELNGAESVAIPSSLNQSSRGGCMFRSTTRSDVNSAPSPSLIELDEVDSLEQTWAGPGAPLGASKAMIEAYQNRLDREPTDGDIEIIVVCNDMEMDAERDIVNDVYGSRDELPFDVSVYREISTDDLHDILERDIDFLHYIGHIDEDGFECVDGQFDASTLSYSGSDAFFLNACTSYQQGMHLIKAGSIAGVVTLQDVINSGAERVGKSLARLLNCGFPLRAALNIAKTQSIMGGHYLVIGDGNLDIAQTVSGIPALYEINRVDQDRFELLYRTFPTRHKSMGSVTIPFVAENDQYHLTSGEAGSYSLSKTETLNLLSKESLPVLSNHVLAWSDDPSILNKI